MHYVKLGGTGLKVSRLCLGCMSYGASPQRPWALSEDQSLPFFRRALEEGINFFDTANGYSAGESERITGKALKAYAQRDEVVIATKVYSPMGPGPNNRGLSRKHILASIDNSLKRLDTDFVDLYQIHRFDYETPIEETLEALNDVVRAGKARYIGASSMFAWQMAKMLATSDKHGWSRFVSMQPQYNLVYREEEREMLPLCQEEEIGVIPWSPLARGFLAGARGLRGQGESERARADTLHYQDEDFAVAEAVSAVAKTRAVTNTQIALAWVLGNPVVTAPIVGATQLHHLDDAVTALTIQLDDNEVEAIEAPYRPKAVEEYGALRNPGLYRKRRAS